MKKLILVLAILVSAPVFALTVSLNDEGGGIVAVNYADANAADLPRGFALDITVSGGGRISAIGNYKTDGESTSGSKGYGIYPSTIDINETTGVVNSYGNPLSLGKPGSGPALPASHLVLELGSLYVGDANAPATSGTLCKLTVDCNGASGSINIKMTAEATYRGGLVLESGATADVNVTLAYSCAPAECVKSTAPFYTVWVGGGGLPWSRPTCWCYKRNCRGDADGLKALNLYWVYSQDLAILKDAYAKTDGNLIGNRICADFNRDKQLNLYRVYTNDLATLKTYYAKTEAQTPVCDMTNYNFWTN